MYPSTAPFSHRIEPDGSETRVVFIGEFDAASVLDLEESGFVLILDTPVVIDLGELTLLDSTAIGFLHRWYEAARTKGMGFRVEVRDPMLEELFGITGLTERLSVRRLG